MFEEEKRRQWLKKQLKKQLVAFCNKQKVVIDIEEMAVCLEEVANDIKNNRGFISN